MRWTPLVLSLAMIFTACKTGGEYQKGQRNESEVDRGETNGRMFDFVSNKPDGDDWQIRVRGDSLWSSYSDEEKSDDLGTKHLTAKEASKLWDLIDAIDIAGRKKGKKDEDEGYVQLRLREPGEGEDGESHKIFQIYVSRTTEDEDVIALAEYLQELVSKYTKEKPNF
ncbi:MAG TPA: hypothetical protein VGM39_15350 [Kofleriaceae bacterium]